MSAAPRFVQPMLPMLALEAVDVSQPRRVPVRAHLRRVTGEPTPSGEERRDAALLKLEAKAATQKAVSYVRAQLLELYHSRLATTKSAFVTADDVERILRDWPLCPDEAKAAYGPQHWRGTVFRGHGWKQTGQTVPSLRPHMNATALPCWIHIERTS